MYPILGSSLWHSQRYSSPPQLWCLAESSHAWQSRSWWSVCCVIEELYVQLEQSTSYDMLGFITKIFLRDERSSLMVIGRMYKLSAISILLGILMLTYMSSSQTTRASSVPITFQVNGKPYNFTVTIDSSSTFTTSITRYSESKFNFTLDGTGTGWANATLCKTAGFFPPGQAKPQNTKIYLNGTRIMNGTDTTLLVEKIDPSQPVTCIWVYWTFHHSQDQFSMDLSLAVPLQQAPVFDGAIPLLAVTILVIAGYTLSKQRTLRQK